MRVLSTTIYEFDELTPSAQARAISATSSLMNVEKDLEATKQAIISAGAQLGICVQNGKEQPSIYFVPAPNQSQGIAYYAKYTFTPGVMQNLDREGITDPVLKRIALDLSKLQNSLEFKLSADIVPGQRSSGNTYSITDEQWDCDRESETALKDIFWRFDTWAFKCLSEKYDDAKNDAKVAAYIRNNHLEFL